MNKKQVDRQVKGLWKCVKARIIDWQQYKERKTILLQCEEDNCTRSATMTISVIGTTKGKNKVIRQYRSCWDCFTPRKCMPVPGTTYFVSELEGNHVQ